MNNAHRTAKLENRRNRLITKLRESGLSANQRKRLSDLNDELGYRSVSETKEPEPTEQPQSISVGSKGTSVTITVPEDRTAAEIKASEQLEKQRLKQIKQVAKTKRIAPKPMPKKTTVKTKAFKPSNRKRS